MRGLCLHAGLFAVLSAALACDGATAPHASATLKISIPTIGVDAPPFSLTVDGRPLGALAGNDSVILRGVAPGSHTVALASLRPNCTVAELGTQTVAIADGATESVAFHVTCGALSAVLEATAHVVGLDAPVRFSIAVDGSVAGQVAANGTMNVVGLSGGDHVIELRDLPSNCSAVDGASRTVTVAVGGITRDTARVAYNASCHGISGILAVTLSASGLDLGDSFAATIDDHASLSLAPSGTVRTGIATGRHVVRLAAHPQSCTAVREADTVSVASGTTSRDTVHVAFDVICELVDLIAFQRDYNIYVVRPDGTGVLAVTNGIQPSWAPDRGQLVLSRSDCESGECWSPGLVIADFRSGRASMRSLTTQPDYGPAWSPAGTRIAFYRDASLFLIDPDRGIETKVALPGMVQVSSRPAWSPDATRLAFGCIATGYFYQDICVVNADGTGFARLTDTGLLNSQPAWSPDGQFIAFTRSDFPSRNDPESSAYIAVVQADGSGFARLADGMDPAWSRDGTRIVFHSFGTPGLATVRLDGTGLTQLTTQPYDHVPAWRP